MKTFEDILDQALLELKKGTPKAEVISRWPEHQAELLEFLNIAETFTGITTNPVPRPQLQRKYLHVVHKSGLLNVFMNLSNFVAISAAALLLIAGTAYSAMQSLPGQPLFSLKKSTEQMQLHFANSDVEKANIQLNISKKRLADAQKVFSDPGATADQQSAALAEVTTQTTQTLQAVKTAATTNNTSNNPIAASLQDLSEQQENLINQIQNTDNTQTPTTSPSSQTKAIAQLREVQAATNEQASLIALNPDPDAITATGTLASISKDTLKINGTEFGVNDHTTFKNDLGTSTVVSTMPEPGSTVLVIATREKSGGKLVAKNVLVLKLPEDSSPATTTAGSIDPQAASTTRASSRDIDTIPSSNDTPEIDNSNQAIGTFIPEDPSPQSPQFNN